MSETQTRTLSGFLLARIAEDESAARICAEAFPAPWDVNERGHAATVRADGPNFWVVSELDQDQETPGRWPGEHLDHIARHDPDRVLSECKAKRRIIEWHQNWPVLVQGPDEFEPSFGADGSLVDQMSMRVTRQLAWITEQKYREAFGDEPPTGPILLMLALPYADHPDFDPLWLDG